MVYDYIAGYEKHISDYQAVWVPGKLALFSNIDHGQPIARPRTILVDSLQFESGEELSPMSSRRSPPPRSRSSAPSTPAASPAARPRTSTTARSCAR